MIQRILNCARVALGRSIVWEDNKIPNYSTISSLPTVAATFLGPLNNHVIWMTFFIQEIQEHIGSSVNVKNLMIDVLIIHLFKKYEQKVFRRFAKNAVHDALKRLQYFKNQRTCENRQNSIQRPLGNNLELESLPHSAAVFSRASEPSSNIVTVGTEPRESELGCNMMMDSESVANQRESNVEALSQTAVSGSQPVTSECRISTMSHLPEEELCA